MAAHTDPMDFLVASQANDKRISRLLEYGPAAIAILEFTGRVITITPSFTRIFGYTIEDIPHIDAWWPLAYPEPTYCAERRSS
jgi:two-component system sensor histidine kinase/response regulator